MRPELEMQLTLLAGSLRGKPASDTIARVMELWRAEYPEPLPEDSQWWDGQQRIAKIVPDLARHSWRDAMRLATLIFHPALREKTRYRCYLVRQNLAKELALHATERAVCIALGLPQEFRTETILYIAEQLFASKPSLALELYQQLPPNRWMAESFLRKVALYDWRTALRLAEPHGLHEDGRFLTHLVQIVVERDFALAEEIASRITPAERSHAVAVLIQHLPPLCIEEILALMERPFYAAYRIQIFSRFSQTIRQYCGLPAEESGGFVRPDDEAYWEHLRTVLRKTEADLRWALEQVRAVSDYEKRRYLFAYVAAEFCHTR